MRYALITILFVGSNFIVGVATSSEEVYSQKERDQFRDGVEKGCLNKQSRDEINAHILPVVIEESCKCYADKITAKVFGSVKFQLARFHKDNEATNRAIAEIMLPAETTNTLMACLQVSIDQRGGQSKIVRDIPYSPSSTQIGLKGDSRRGFVNTGLQTCKTSQSQMPENRGINENTIDAYCDCHMNYIADRVSPANTMDMLKQQSYTTKLLAKLSKASANYCREKIFGVKSK